MMGTQTSMERVLTALSHREPDRVPLCLTLSLYGAKELQVPVKEYFSRADNVVRAQLSMREKYHNDCFYTFFYAPIEVEAWGGEVLFVDDGPPNSGEPFIKTTAQISSLAVPNIRETDCLQRVLQVTENLRKRVGTTVPIIGVVMSPFSLPVMQIGFEKYIELLYGQDTAFNLLMKINEEFCVAWANAQLSAGASAICYFDPLASPLMVEREQYLKTGHPVAMRTISRINGPVAIHLASGQGLPVIDDISATGAAILGFSALDSTVAMKSAARDKISLLGNLNGLEMIDWSIEKTEREVKALIAKAGMGGGLLVSDNHGEIPWQVPEEVLLQVSEAVRRWGQYPLRWVEEK